MTNENCANRLIFSLRVAWFVAMALGAWFQIDLLVYLASVPLWWSVLDNAVGYWDLNPDWDPRRDRIALPVYRVLDVLLTVVLVACLLLRQWYVTAIVLVLAEVLQKATHRRWTQLALKRANQDGSHDERTTESDSAGAKDNPSTSGHPDDRGEAQRTTNDSDPVQQACALRSTEPVRSFVDLLALAEQGIPRAMLNLAWNYQAGVGVERSSQLAHEWYRRAYEEADSDYTQQQAIYLLGYLHYGRGEFDKATDAWALGAERNFPPCLFRLGQMYRLGDGVKRQPQLAYQLLERGAAAGYFYANRDLALLMISGRLGINNILKGLRLQRLNWLELGRLTDFDPNYYDKDYFDAYFFEQAHRDVPSPREPRPRKPKGSVQIGALSDVPVYLHWSFPLGALVPAAFIGFPLVPSLYLVVAYVLLAGIHQWGHLVAATATNHKAAGMLITGFGGRCRVETPKTMRSAFIIAAGGLVTQLVALLLAVAYMAAMGGTAQGVWSNTLIMMFTVWNGASILLSFLPIKRKDPRKLLDGQKLWALTRLAWKNREPDGSTD